MKISFVHSALAVGVALTLSLASCAAAETPKKEEAPVVTYGAVPAKVKVYVQATGGSYAGAYNFESTTAKAGTPVVAAVTAVNPAGSYNAFKVDLEYASTVAVGTKVKFKVSAVSLTATGVTVPATTAGGINWEIKAVAAPWTVPAGNTVTDNKDGTYTFEATVADGSTNGGTANMVQIEWDFLTYATAASTTAYGLTFTSL